MKVNNVLGEFGFKALVRGISPLTSTRVGYWLSDDYYLNEDEAKRAFSPNHYEVRWPVEQLDNGGVYIPSKEELE